MKISTNMVNGAMSPAMVLAGGRARSWPGGHPIVTATGSMLDLGAGRGSKTSLGDSLLSTTVAGHLWATVGSGFRDRSSFVQSGRPLWWRSWVVVRDSASLPVLASDGSRSLQEKSIFPDTTSAAR